MQLPTQQMPTQQVLLDRHKEFPCSLSPQEMPGPYQQGVFGDGFSRDTHDSDQVGMSQVHALCYGTQHLHRASKASACNLRLHTKPCYPRPHPNKAYKASSHPHMQHLHRASKALACNLHHHPNPMHPQDPIPMKPPLTPMQHLHRAPKTSACNLSPHWTPHAF